MFCEKCGDKVDINETYCNQCGNFLGNRQQLQQQNQASAAVLQQKQESTPVVAHPLQQAAGEPLIVKQEPMQIKQSQVVQRVEQQFQNLNQSSTPSVNINNNNDNNNNMFGNNVRSLNQQMMNINYNQQPNMMNNQNTMNINYTNQQPKQPNKKRKSMLVGGVVGALLFAAVAFIVVSNFGDLVYISDNSYNEEEKENANKKTKTKTVIVYDNKYTGVSVKNEKDANNLIVKDSVDQKGACPKEITAIEDTIIKNYGITAVNLCEMDADFAKEVGNVFKVIYEEYPGAKGYLTNLTLVNAPISSGYIAAFQPIFTFATSATDSTYPWVLKTQIYLNTSYFLNKTRLETSVESGSATGHFPPNATIYSPVAHEMGHYLSFLAMMNNYKVDSILLIQDKDTDMLYQLIDDFGSGKFSLLMITEAYNKFKKELGTSLTIDEWRATISSYAVAKDNSGNYIYDETIAEAFHDVYLNKDKAAKASKYVVSVLKEKLKKGA